MSAYPNPLVSIITLNYNGTDTTCRFLESTRLLTHKNFEILVCDMNSTHDPSALINKGNYPATTVLRSHENLGFAGGNNWGMRQAKGEFFFIVNNDTEVTADLLEKLLAPFFSDPQIAVVCPKIKYYHNPEYIQYAGFAKMNMFTGRTSTIGDKQKDDGRFDTPGYTFGAHGCAMMVKREVAEKTGMFPEKFFLYYEEWDWSMRIRNAGYKIFYEPSAVIYHKESMSVGKESLLKEFYLSRNRILFMRRNCSGFQWIVFLLFYSCFTFPKTVFTYTFSGNFKRLKTYLKAVGWNFTHSKNSTV
ncbi:MAG: glycosyltransferase family 2 protein [Chitinophagaceae bacterium]|nr:glycosyltransferase family 2 protein [Chitinophagaceae bacterium]